MKIFSYFIYIEFKSDNANDKVGLSFAKPWYMSVCYTTRNSKSMTFSFICYILPSVSSWHKDKKEPIVHKYYKTTYWARHTHSNQKDKSCCLGMVLDVLLAIICLLKSITSNKVFGVDLTTNTDSSVAKFANKQKTVKEAVFHRSSNITNPFKYANRDKSKLMESY